ncbi:ADK-domain-containing protein [Microstroma glucosiphilum]|uniref:ADK-domain-containing protein n=1 Tax=Pseudomicrostroma glucosiphilum TaxID=1684307 RepID=A0A316U4F7_9BASI|nr:ADK-domain-containing protein [Pseudomicrostroma glucosiphilum]PWN20142.1 ADK-domain-containing protein [Pseudomicrostroma glucosiphilum]
MAVASCSSAAARLVPLLRPAPRLTQTAWRRNLSSSRRCALAAVVDSGHGQETVSAASAEARPTQVRMLLVGCPGSGKGTLSSLLHSTYPELSSISAGDLLRQHIERGTELGKKADGIIKRGDLMDDETMMQMVGKEVEEKGAESWLLDGFPRTTGQARLLDEALQRQGRPLNLVVNLDVPEEVILKRILDRWVHPPSGRVYNSQYNPPKVAGKDDETGEPLVQRPDDNEKTFTSRLTSFHRQTGPMIAHYASHSSCPPLSLALSQAPQPRDDERVYVSLKGETSKAIWPLLKGVMRKRERRGWNGVEEGGCMRCRAGKAWEAWG